MIGELIGNFRVTAQLGQGGMGEVWRAEHKEIKTKVAIKMLLPHISADQQQIERFFNEAVAVSKIKHSGIAKIFDVGFHKGRAYLVMEFLDGEPLASRIQRTGRLSLGSVADFARQIAGVLEATHVAGITHRDLKPDNIFLVSDSELASGERVKILDFGIAKLNAAGLTSTGAGAMGTPSYMSPEQWRSSAKVDGRADAYALGCVVFEMVCGRPPFLAESIGEAYHMHTTLTPPSIRSVISAMPEQLDSLVARLLSKDPAARPSMPEIKAAFLALGKDQPHVTDPTMSVDAILPIARPAAMPPAASTPLARSWSAGSGGGGLAPQTTLGSSAGVVEVARRGSRPSWWIAVGGVAIGGVVAAWAILRSSHPNEATTIAQPPAPPAAEPRPAPPQPAAPPRIANPFIAIAPPSSPVELGLDTAAPEHDRGFRPARHIAAPTAGYAIQAHEVTWGEVAPWLTAHGDAIEDPEDRATVGTRHDEKMPVTGLTWSTALAYCKGLDASLPTEEQWEYAARGRERRPNAWGTGRVDLARTRAFRGETATPAPAESSDQDVTPDHQLHDLTGNAQEWTVDLWRDDRPDQDERWVADPKTGTSFRAIRGLPLGAPPPDALPAEAAAYREPLCATGACVERSRKALRFVGFRCVRR